MGKVKNHPYLTIIGYFTNKETGAKLINGLNEQIDLTAQGWNPISKEI